MDKKENDIYDEPYNSDKKSINQDEYGTREEYPNPFFDNVTSNFDMNEVFDESVKQGVVKGDSPELADDGIFIDLNEEQDKDDKSKNEVGLINPVFQTASSENLPFPSFNESEPEIEVLTMEDDRMGVDNLINGSKTSEERKTEPSKFGRNRIIILIITIIALMIIAVSQALAFDAKNMNSSMDGIWDIAFVKMYKKSVVGTAEEVRAPSFNSLKASFGVSLKQPSDEITYELTIKNRGSIDARLSSINIIPENRENDYILYYVDGIKVGDKLDAGRQTTMTLTARFNRNSTTAILTSKKIEVVLSYKQK